MESTLFLSIFLCSSKYLHSSSILVQIDAGVVASYHFFFAM